MISTNISTDRKFISTKNAATLAGYSIRHFRRIMEDGKVPFIVIGRKFFITGPEFNKWAKRQEVEHGS